ncbi:helix-turn-helix transcriptional regulator [Mycolicibacterium sp. D5.8-2]|jgi:DNA-binding CsgD family transcriptional regulator|uniref:helix-turn-helix transcriptional regulator n=1 Tax=Mycolicibacterium sp. D5.8-2 TaxID=3085903 RepID=UPI00298D1572|nr:AAA family ATPase [Mycolicibacterium sp. D5.8-2]MDW5611754.1 AAA family ATPase [Mycolicibacterium sp. D5.8-2]
MTSSAQPIRPSQESQVELVGRRAERRALDGVLSAVSAGRSGVLVLSGEAGIGKTALLDEVAGQIAEGLLVRVAGVESETEFAYAALHQLCIPLFERIEQIPGPQRAALLTAFGQRRSPTPDPFLVGLAVLSLVSEFVHQCPVFLIIDDQQWLDRASSIAIAFVARRLSAEPVGVVFATRTVGEELRGLPELVVGGLTDDDSRELLALNLDGPLDTSVRDRIIVEARGNPLALLEIPRALGRTGLAGGFGAPGVPLTHSLEGAFRHQLHGLPLPTRRLLALAAAEPAGDASTLWRAAEVLGIETNAAVPAVEAGLAEIGSRVRFRHPLIRSTAYRSVALSDRQLIHSALAAVIDRELDPDRRAWHLGHAAIGPDDEVAAELERCATRVRARGGVAAAAAFLERASALTLDPSNRCDRTLAAASAKAQAGALDVAKDLLKVADAAPMTELQRAQTDLVRAQLAFISNHGNDAAPLLLGAARRLESIDPTLARETYLDTLSAAIFAGRLAVDGGVLEVSEAASAATRSLNTPGAADLLLDGMTTQHSAGFEKGLPNVREALRIYGPGMTTEQELRWMFLACVAAAHVWDLDRLMSLAVRHVQLSRDTGAVSELPLALSCLITPLLFTGRFGEAARAIDELTAAIDAMGNNLTPYGALSLAAMSGRRDHLQRLGSTAIHNAEHRGEGIGLTVNAWATALLENGHGRYHAAAEAAVYATSYPGDCTSAGWALIELVEAGSRTGDDAVASAALERLTEMTTPSGTDWGLGVEARSRALTTEGDAAEALYLEAIERLGRAGMGPDQGRAHLLYGEWLRRRRRRVDARAQLRSAHHLFDSIGMDAFAERARVELLATGETAQKRTSSRVAALTAQEAQIARLARDGLSNPEIGARLFISARTVQYHLSKVFAKLGIRSRSQLEHSLPELAT